MLTAGGTGGHLFPAIALSQALTARGYKTILVTDKRGEKYRNDTAIPEFEILNVSSPAGDIVTKIKSGISMTAGYFKARSLLKKYRPAPVAGFGGYPSFPLMMAAQHTNVPNIIHEQNAVIGKANLVMARNADRIAISLPKIIGLSKAEKDRVAYTGNPVRDEIRNIHDMPYSAPDAEQDFTILLIGGSQGASVFSQIVPKALSRLPDHEQKRLRIIQQCRSEDLQDTRNIYKEMGIRAEVESFFHDMPERLKEAHLVISRAGASTVAEVTTAGLPAIFVPYPWHRDQQQKMNADIVSDHGGAWVMAQDGFTEEALSARLLTFLQEPGILNRAAKSSRECARPDAASRLADVIENILENTGVESLEESSPDKLKAL